MKTILNYIYCEIVDFRLTSLIIASLDVCIDEVIERIRESQRVVNIVWEVHADVLMGIVQSIVALEIEKSCWTTHCRNWSHKGISLTRVKNSTGSVSVDSDPDLLTHKRSSLLLRVRVGFQLSSCPHEFVLSCRAGIVAPKSFEVDGANITTSSLCTEDSIYLFEVFSSEFIIDFRAASQSFRLDVIFAGSDGS